MAGAGGTTGSPGRSTQNNTVAGLRREIQPHRFYINTCRSHDFWFDFGIILAQDSRALVGVQETGRGSGKAGSGLEIGDDTIHCHDIHELLVIIAPSDPSIMP